MPSERPRGASHLVQEFVAAQRLYESLGFLLAPAVSYNPVPGTRFLALGLRA